MTKNLILLGMAAVVVAALSGCYTQVGVVRNDQDDSQQQYTSDQPADTQAEPGDDYSANGNYTNNDDWCYNHPRVGFSYYYPSSYWPSTAFSIAYNDPWFYDSYAWGYSPYSYGYGFGYPVYGYSPYGYYPGYAYGYGYGNGYYHGGDHGYAHRNPRTFGSTRGGDASVNPGGITPAGYMDLPSATRHATSGGSSARGQNATGTRSVGSTRSTSTPTTQGSSGRGSTLYPDLNNPAPTATSLPSATSRGSQPATRPSSTVSHPATHRGNSNRSGGTSTRSASHGSTQTQGTQSAPSRQPAVSAPAHQPAPAAAPAPSGGRSSSPAPAGGGRSSGNGGGGGRGGNTRGGGGR
jgi:hypothetical protein